VSKWQNTGQPSKTAYPAAEDVFLCFVRRKRQRTPQKTAFFVFDWEKAGQTAWFHGQREHRHFACTMR
jgi:hypothetical protein